MTDHLQAATPSRRDFLKTCAAGVSASAITTLIPAGVKSAAVDSIISLMVSAKTEAQYRAACRTLDRVISHSHVLLPQWFAGTHRMAYNAWRLERPKVTPPYFRGETWAIDTWWARNPPGTR